MIVLKLKFDWAGFRNALRRKQAALTDLRPEMQAIGAWLIADARKRLAARGAGGNRACEARVQLGGRPAVDSAGTFAAEDVENAGWGNGYAARGVQ